MSASNRQGRNNQFNKKNNSFDLFQTITDKICAELENGRIPWRKMWGLLADGTTEVPRNYISKRPYSGINSLLLSCSGYKRPYFVTLKEANQLGGRVKAGERGNLVVFWKIHKTQKEAKNGDNKDVSIPLLRYFLVFNIEQIDGVEFNLPELINVAQIEETLKIEACEDIYKNYPNPPALVFKDPNRAFYSPLWDVVNMPPIRSFSSPYAYYSVKFHELVHSTGHADRLNREELVKTDGFGGEVYAKEELTAEMGACFLLARSGIDMNQYPELLINSAAYLRSWLTRLKNDKMLLVRAAGQAEKAVQYILGTSQPVTSSEEIESDEELS